MNILGDEQVNFIYMLPNDYFWTDISQMLEFLKLYDNPDITKQALLDGLRKGLKRTTINGYNITKIEKDGNNE